MVQKSGESFEENVGIKWFARIGILALVLGIGFFIKYAIDNNLIGYFTRIIVGLCIGLLLVVVGEIMSKKENYLVWSRTLSGGGIAIMYFSAYAAYYFEEYRKAIGISFTVDLIALTLVILLGLFLSIKDDSKIIVAETFFLGFLTSLLSRNFEVITLLYNLLLTFGLVVIVLYKKWSIFGLGGVLATYIVFLPWYITNLHTPGKFWLSMFFLLSYFIIYNLQSLLINEDKEESVLTINFTLLNSLFFFLLSYILVRVNYYDFRGIYLFALAVVYFIFYLFSNSKEKLRAVYLSLTLFSLTIALFAQLNANYIGLAWAFETLVLTYIGTKFEIKIVKNASFVVGILTILRLLTHDAATLAPFNYQNIFESTRLFTFIISAAVFYLCAYFYRRKKSNATIKNTYVFAATFLTALIILLEAKNQWETLLLTLLFLLLLIFCSFMKDSYSLRYSSFILGIILLLKLMIFDRYSLNGADSIFRSVRALTFLLVALSFYVGSWLRIMDEDHLFSVVYSWFGSLVLALVFWIELNGYWISSSWAVLGLVLMVVGLIISKSQIRLQGIVIIFLAILKVFLYDIWNLNTIYRTISFIVLGVILLLVSLLYSKYREKVRAFVTQD